jgi:acyl-CoA dehydrogenase
VLRKKPPGKILSSAHAVEREYAVQKALGLLSSPRVPVPRMATLCEDASVLGTPFYLMSFARGHIFLQPGLESLPSAAHRSAVYDAMADTLGALHRVDPKKAGLEGFGKPDNYSRRQVERWARQYRESVATPEPFMTELIEWLRAHVPASEPSGRIVHGDFRLDNLVFENKSGPLGGGLNRRRGRDENESGVVAVLDWELATVGAPYSDVAYCCMPYHLPRVDASNPGMASTAYPAFGASIPDGIPSEKAFVARWAAAAGLPNPAEGAGAATRWPFYVAMSLFRGAAILAGVRARAAAGNASAANAHAAGTLVETLATRALSVAGCVPGGVPRGVGASVGKTYAPPALVSSGLEPSARAAALLQRLRGFMVEHALPAEAALEAHAASDARWSVSPETERLKALAKRAGLWNLWLPADSRELLKVDVPAGADGALLQGPGLTNLEYAHLAAEMGQSVWASEFFNCSAPDTGNMEVLLRYGTKTQQEEWLVPLLLGEIRSCFAMTEPAVASSDATNIASSIVKDATDQNRYVLNGRKWWTSGACDPRCALAIFMGKTAPDGAAPKHKQQSMVLVPMKSPGVRVLRPLSVFGYDDAPHGHAEVTFTDVRVDRSGSVLLGEGRGFEIAQGRLGPGRLHHCMRLIGMGERALSLAARRAADRVAFGKPLAANGNVLQTLGVMRVTLDGARLATLEAARRLDKEGNKTAKGAIAACKVAAPKAALFVIDAAIQLHGGLGVCDDQPLARMFAGARTLRLADGPDEVHLETIAKMELRRAKL